MLIDTLAPNAYLLYGQSVPFPSNEEFLIVMQSAIYQYTLDILEPQIRSVTIAIFDANGDSTTFTTIIRLKPLPSLPCGIITPRDVDVVFLLDSSTTSSSSYFWAITRTFTAEVISLLPVSSTRTRFALMTDLRVLS